MTHYSQAGSTRLWPKRSRLGRGIQRFGLHPGQAVLELWKRVPVGSFRLRLDFDAFRRPHYAYCLYNACLLARSLGIPSISALEFGVAGGRGLLELEQLAELVIAETGVGIEIFGFDFGEGLPSSDDDFRNLPYTWRPGLFTMDTSELERRLTRARLVLGDVAETVPPFIAKGDLPPIGFVAFDLDYYSSTRAALLAFECEYERILPRVYCYFDDTIGPDEVLHNDFVGELLAIKEFNESHRDRKVAPINGLRHKRLVPATWCDAVFAFHAFEHPLYNAYLGDDDDVLDLHGSVQPPSL